MAGIILGLVASAFGILWLAVSAAGVAIAGALMQYRENLPFEMLVGEDAWKERCESFSIVVPKRVHKKVSPTGILFQGQKPNFEEVTCDVSHDLNGVVTFSVKRPMRGKIVIK